MSLKKIKRERSINFIDSELQLLVDLVDNKKQILENKNTDAVTANQKNKTWEALSNKFNCKSLNGYRSPKCLKLKYENLKKNVKIKLRDVKSKPCVTGGGPPIPLKALSKLSPMEEQLRSLNPLAFGGKVSAFDSDRIDDQNTYRHEMLEQDYEKTDSDCMDENIDENILEFDCQENNTNVFQESLVHTSERECDIGEDWTDYTPAKLRTPISSELSSIIHKKSLDTQYSPNIYANTEASSDDELKVRNPQKNLKSNKMSVHTKKQTSIINTNKDWSDTAKTKTKLMQLKIMLLEEELVFKRKENKLELKLLTVELASKET